MTIHTISAARRCTDPLGSHAYRVPIVRELPPRLPDAPDELTW